MLELPSFGFLKVTITRWRALQVIQRISTTVIDVVDAVSIVIWPVCIKVPDLLLPTMQQQCANVNQLVLIIY